MKLLLSLLLTIITLLTSCTKDVGKKEEKFVAGDLFIGIKSDAELKTVFNALNDENLKIKQMSVFNFHAHLPADSVKPLLAFLSTKPYITSGNTFSAYAYYYTPEKAIRVLSTYVDMSPQNQSDFLNMIDSLKWTNLHSEQRYMFLTVPVGREKFWLNELKKYPFVTWTELNAIYNMKLH